MDPSMLHRGLPRTCSFGDYTCHRRSDRCLDTGRIRLFAHSDTAYCLRIRRRLRNSMCLDCSSVLHRCNPYLTSTRRRCRACRRVCFRRMRGCIGHRDPDSSLGCCRSSSLHPVACRPCSQSLRHRHMWMFLGKLRRQRSGEHRLAHPR